MRSQAGPEEHLSAFTFGPYPDETKLRELRAHGYTAVISLLHPAVVPFEPQLIEREKVAAAEAGIQLVHAPMLPWISDNRASVERLRRLIRRRNGRYYVHCYLGVDRVLVVKRLIEQEAAGRMTVTGVSAIRGPLERRRFERGRVIRVDRKLYVGPHPTPEELLKIASSDVQHVVSLVDTNEPDHEQRVSEIATALAPLRITHTVHRLTSMPYDPAAILRAAEGVRALSATVFVHEFYGPGSERAPLADGFLSAYRTRREPLSPFLATVHLGGGPVRVIRADAAIGPRPRASEFGAILASGGVETFVCIGNGSSGCAADRSVCADHHLRHITAPSEAAAAELLIGNGPVYVYRPGAALPGPIPGVPDPTSAIPSPPRSSDRGTSSRQPAAEFPAPMSEFRDEGREGPGTLRPRPSH